MLLQMEIENDRQNLAIRPNPESAAICEVNRVAFEMFGESLQVIWKPHVIVRKKGDEIALRLTECDIAVRIAEPRTLREVIPSDSRVIEGRDNLRGRVSTPVSHHKQFKVLLGLIEGRLDGKGDHIGPIMSWQQDAELQLPAALNVFELVRDQVGI